MLCLDQFFQVRVVAFPGFCAMPAWHFADDDLF